MPQIVDLPNGETAEFPDGMRPEAIAYIVGKQFPPSSAAEKLATLPANARELGQRIIGDLPERFREFSRPFRLTLGMEAPKDVKDYAQIVAGTAVPLSLAGKAATALGAPALAGRVAGAGGMAATREMAEGHGFSSVPMAALLDMAIAGVTEGIGGYLGSKLTKAAKPITDARKAMTEGVAEQERGFKWATDAPEKAIGELRERLNRVTAIVVPSLSKTKLTIDEAVKKLVEKTGAEYETAYKELVNVLNRVDKQRLSGGPRPFAGQVFKARTSPERFTPSGVALKDAVDEAVAEHPFGRVAEAALPAVKSNVAKSAADAATTAPVTEDLSFGKIAAMSLASAPEALRHLYRKVVPVAP